MFIITTNKILPYIVKRFFQEEEIRIISPSSTRKLEAKNDIILTDEAEFTKLIKKPIEAKTIAVFIENISQDRIIQKILNSKDPLKLSYKLRDLIELISFCKQVLKGDIDISNRCILCKNDTRKTEFTIDGDIKYIPEETLDKILSFIEENGLTTKIDRDSVIISSSEIIDNIIEVYISLNQVIGKIKLELKSNEDYFAVSISDYLGLADIYSISRSLKSDLITNSKGFYEKNINELVDSITIRGRGYTLMKRTSNRVITTILREENKLKYRCSSGFTRTDIIYYFNKKRKDNSLNMVIEFC